MAARWRRRWWRRRRLEAVGSAAEGSEAARVGAGLAVDLVEVDLEAAARAAGSEEATGVEDLAADLAGGLGGLGGGGLGGGLGGGGLGGGLGGGAWRMNVEVGMARGVANFGRFRSSCLHCMRWMCMYRPDPIVAANASTVGNRRSLLVGLRRPKLNAIC